MGKVKSKVSDTREARNQKRDTKPDPKLLQKLHLLLLTIAAAVRSCSKASLTDRDAQLQCLSAMTCPIKQKRRG